MNTWPELLIAHTVRLAVLAALAGIVARKRYRVGWSFPAYLLLILVFNTLVTFWPQRFYVRSFWMIQQTAYDVAKLAVAIELAVRAFGAFPGARATARVVFSVILVVTTAGIATLSADAGSDWQLEWHYRIISGTIWLMAATGLLVVRYHLPVHPYHRAILLGFVPYLLVFTTLLNVLQHYGSTWLYFINAFDGTAYLLFALWWTYSSWRRDEEVVDIRELTRRFRKEAA